MNSRTCEPIVNTSCGPICGEICTSLYGDKYYRFQKVPYASPPIGELRFKAPVPPKPWKNVLNCKQTMPKATQFDHLNKMDGTEDCLYLTICTKNLKSQYALPVLVFIHGGGFDRGDPNRGADYFMMRDVVLVTFAYRLGPFGFLSFKDRSIDVPGNAGLKDQIQALRWVKDNVQNFNGDPQNITVFGNSAGGAAVHHLLLTPQTEGLFHKAIIMSGVTRCTFGLSYMENPTYRLAKHMGFRGEFNDKNVFEFFCKAEAHDMISSKLLSHSDIMNNIHFAWVPVVEPYLSASCVIAAEPNETMMKNAWSNKIPIIIGGNSHEGLLVYALTKSAPNRITDLESSPHYLLPLDVRGNLTKTQATEMEKEIRKIHFGNKKLNLDCLLEYCEYISYKAFWLPIVRSVMARMSGQPAPTYLYRFAFDSPTFNHHRIMFCGDECRGAAHADDLSYLFYGYNAPKLEPDTAEFKTIVRMIDLWTSFAAKSQPNCLHTENDQWLPLQLEEPLHCLNISNELSFIPLPENEKLSVWLKLYSPKILSKM